MRIANGGLMSRVNKHVQQTELEGFFSRIKIRLRAVAIVFPPSSNRQPVRKS